MALYKTYHFIQINRMLQVILKPSQLPSALFALQNTYELYKVFCQHLRTRQLKQVLLIGLRIQWEMKASLRLHSNDVHLTSLWIRNEQHHTSVPMPWNICSQRKVDDSVANQFILQDMSLHYILDWKYIFQNCEIYFYLWKLKKIFARHPDTLAYQDRFIQNQRHLWNLNWQVPTSSSRTKLSFTC